MGQAVWICISHLNLSVSQAQPSAVTQSPEFKGLHSTVISHSCQSPAQLRDLAHDIVQGPSSFPFMVLPSSRASSSSPGFSGGGFGARPGNGKHHRPLASTWVPPPTPNGRGSWQV